MEGMHHRTPKIFLSLALMALGAGVFVGHAVEKNFHTVQVSLSGIQGFSRANSALSDLQIQNIQPLLELPEQITVSQSLLHRKIQTMVRVVQAAPVREVDARVEASAQDLFGIYQSLKTHFHLLAAGRASDPENSIYVAALEKSLPQPSMKSARVRTRVSRSATESAKPTAMPSLVRAELTRVMSAATPLQLFPKLSTLNIQVEIAKSEPALKLAPAVIEVRERPKAILAANSQRTEVAVAGTVEPSLAPQVKVLKAESLYVPVTRQIAESGGAAYEGVVTQPTTTVQPAEKSVGSEYSAATLSQKTANPSELFGRVSPARVDYSKVEYSSPAPSLILPERVAAQTTTPDYNPGSLPDANSGATVLALSQAAVRGEESATGTTGAEAESDSFEAPFIEALLRDVPVDTKLQRDVWVWNGTAGSEKSSSRTGSVWEILSSQSHYPTLALIPTNGPKSVAVLSRNMAEMIERYLKMDWNQDTGVIVVRAPAGLELGFSGEAAKAVVFSEGSIPSQEDDARRNRWVIYWNVPPGAEVLRFAKGSQGKSEKKASGASAVPVLAGTATSINLENLEMSTIRGRVSSADDADLRGVARVQVSLVGSDHMPVTTNRAGEFKLGPFLSVPGQSQFLEAQSTQGYKHRHEILAGQFGSAQLYLFSEKHIQDWIGQLQGGVSTQSGLIVAAVPAAEPGDRAWLETSDPQATLEPEVYSLSDREELVPGGKLAPGVHRFLGVQVPHGFAKAAVQSSTGQVRWSRLTVASPGVVSVITPN